VSIVVVGTLSSRPGAVEGPDGDGASGSASSGTPDRSGGVTILVLVVGLLITAAVTWTAWTLNAKTESRLLRVQTEQAGDVLTAAVPNTETPLATAAQIAEVTGGSPIAFTQYFSPFVGPGQQFVSASLWQVDGAGARSVAVVGAKPDLSPSSPSAAALINEALHSKSFVVGGIVERLSPHISYAYGLPGPAPRFVVYAEHAVPADRRSAVAGNSAFADLNYAIYLGSPSAGHLLTTSFNHVPVSGSTDKVQVPFGDSKLTLVTAPMGQLGGTLSARLPWIFGILGVLLTVLAAWITRWLMRRRVEAERDAGQIRSLYGQLGDLYSEQRAIAETLQRALLPHVIPDIPHLEVAVRYVPGTQGMDIGGDWYSVLSIDDRHFAFVVGDVSGRGVSAASVMAALRFTIRTLLLEGNSPAEVLRKCSIQIRGDIEGHFATAVVGIGDLERHEVSLANAGHLNPLLVRAGSTGFVQTAVGVPLGVPGGGYESVTVSTPPTSTMIAFTDGLVERRGESIDVGMDRLATVTGAGAGPLDDLLTTIIGDLTDDQSEDDIAILALRWVP
jgi:serine phosphatase RsbU (regulator of sigma subunit)